MGRYNRDSAYRKSTVCNKKMSILTVNLSDDLYDMLALGKAKGWWCSRSEGIRIALARGLPILIKEMEFMKQLVIESLIIEGKLDPDKEYVRIPGKGYIEILGEA